MIGHALLAAASLAGNFTNTTGAAAANPIPVRDLALATVTVALWAFALAAVLRRQRARERAAAWTHIRSVRVSRRACDDAARLSPPNRVVARSANSKAAERTAAACPSATRPSWTKPLAQA